MIVIERQHMKVVDAARALHTGDVSSVALVEAAIMAADEAVISSVGISHDSTKRHWRHRPVLAGLGTDTVEEKT